MAIARVVPLLVIGGVVASCASHTPQPTSALYDATATRQCLLDRPEYVPNASSPNPKSQMLVASVFQTKRDQTQGPEVIPRGTSVVGVTFTPAHAQRAQTASMSFFPSEASAGQVHAVDASVTKRLQHPERVEQWQRNVLVLWTPNSYSAALRSILFGCLRTGANGS